MPSTDGRSRLWRLTAGAEEGGDEAPALGRLVTTSGLIGTFG